MNGVTTSIKSVNVTAKTYQSLSALRSLISRHARDLASYTFNLGHITEAEVAERVLVVAIEEGAATAAQANLMVQLTREAQYLWPNIKLVFVSIP